MGTLWRKGEKKRERRWEWRCQVQRGQRSISVSTWAPAHFCVGVWLSALPGCYLSITATTGKRLLPPTSLFTPHRHSWEAAQAAAPVGHTVSTFVVACTHLSPSPSPHPQWVYWVFKLKMPCREKQVLLLVVCITSFTLILTLCML